MKDEDDETMDDMTKVEASELAACARDAQDGLAGMKDADRKTREAHQQWIDCALKTAGALYAARTRLVDHAEFGKWCDDNGLSAADITKDERAALIKIGADIGYWRETLAKTESRSLRLITAKRADPFSQAAKSSPVATPHPAPQAESVRSAPAPALSPKSPVVPPVAPHAATLDELAERIRASIAKETTLLEKAVLDSGGAELIEAMKRGEVNVREAIRHLDDEDDDDEQAYDSLSNAYDQLDEAVSSVGLSERAKDGKSYLTIHDREKAVAWFEDALATYDATQTIPDIWRKSDEELKAAYDGFAERQMRRRDGEIVTAPKAAGVR